MLLSIFFQKTYSMEPELHLSMPMYEAISMMEYNKSPVHACGFPMKFYRTIWTTVLMTIFVQLQTRKLPLFKLKYEPNNFFNGNRQGRGKYHFWSEKIATLRMRTRKRVITPIDANVGKTF
jgi:hypothetical protein